MTPARIIELCELPILAIAHLPFLDQVEALNKLRQMLHDVGPFASTQEAMGVALEEWDELRLAIHSNDPEAIQRECLDLAAPLLRLAEQLFDKASPLRRRSVK